MIAEPPVWLGALQLTVRETAAAVTVPMVGAPSVSWALARPSTAKRLRAALAASSDVANSLHGALSGLLDVPFDAMCPPGSTGGDVQSASAALQLINAARFVGGETEARSARAAQALRALHRP